MRRLEDAEQRALCQWLEYRRVKFFAVPNGGKRSKIEAAIMKGLGTRAGVPDILVISRPVPTIVGVAIEMKSATGRVSPEQKEWLETFAAAGWLTLVARSAEEAINFLKDRGY